MRNGKQLQDGTQQDKITITAGPSKFELMLSVMTGKEVAIAIKESNSSHPNDNFDAQFYAVETENSSYHDLNNREIHSDSGEGILTPIEKPWRVKVAIRSKLLDNTVHHYVHYEGIYDAVKRNGSLILIGEK